MNLLDLEKKLIAAGRLETPSDRVPYAFEKRVLSHLIARPISTAALWAEALWRSAGACLAIVAVMGAVALFSDHSKEKPAPNLAVDFEKTMLAALDSEYPR
ncbi:MAG TPA: hypothetical protein VEH04_20400 [Verrucomicrobiae bacterium]|nr:hypothetical protein [Verrucomicrobiae bacterium]